MCGQSWEALLAAPGTPGATSVSGYCASLVAGQRWVFRGRTTCPRVHCDLPGTELHPGWCSWLVRMCRSLLPAFMPPWLPTDLRVGRVGAQGPWQSI